MQLKAKAPGSLMLLGEHAVLFDKPALVSAINQYITVTMTPAHQHNETIKIYSKTHGECATTLSALAQADFVIKKPFHFVLAVIKQMHAKIKRGFDVVIESEFSDQVGFGSSAAVTVAMLACLVKWLDIRISALDLIRQARLAARAAQGGVGSGADIAASVHGGIVVYKAHPLSAEKLNITHPLTVVYSGQKTPTVEVISHVQKHFTSHPELLRQIINGIGECALQGAKHVRKKDWQKLGEVFNIQQGLMEALNVSNAKLQTLITDLRSDKSILGAKISGSGLGDCVVGLGLSKNIPHPCLDAEMTLQGVMCEKI